MGGVRSADGRGGADIDFVELTAAADSPISCGPFNCRVDLIEKLLLCATRGQVCAAEPITADEEKKKVNQIGSRRLHFGEKFEFFRDSLIASNVLSTQPMEKADSSPRRWDFKGGEVSFIELRHLADQVTRRGAVHSNGSMVLARKRLPTFLPQSDAGD